MQKIVKNLWEKLEKIAEKIREFFFAKNCAKNLEKNYELFSNFTKKLITFKIVQKKFTKNCN